MLAFRQCNTAVALAMIASKIGWCINNRDSTVLA